MNAIPLLLLLVGLGCLGAGCATESGGSTLPVSRHYLQEREGLAITVQPLTISEEVDRVFGENILRDGILPIRLSADNQNATSSFIVAREEMLVVNASTGMTNSARRGAVGREVASVPGGEAAGSALLMGAVAPMIMAPLFIVMAVTAKESVNPNVEHNLTGKEFFTRTLGPGQRASGYIYCRFPKNSFTAGAYRIRIGVKNAASGVTTPIEFDVPLYIAKS